MGKLGRKALKKRQAIIRHIPDAAPVDCPICLTILHGMPRVRQRSPVHINAWKHFRQGRAECPICRNCPTYWLYVIDGWHKVHCPCRSPGDPPLMCQTLREARHTCMKINGLELHMREKRRRGNDMIRQLHQNSQRDKNRKLSRTKRLLLQTGQCAVP